MMSTHKQAIDDEKKVAAEEQIRSLRKEIDYNTIDYTIDFLIQQFRNDEFYIPDEYQRQYIWNTARTSYPIDVFFGYGRWKMRDN